MMDNTEQHFDVSDYIVEPQPAPEAVPETVTTGKAKKPRRPKKKPYDRDSTDSDKEDLLKTARVYCKNPHDWNTVRKMKRPKLESWVSEQEFMRQKQIQNNCVHVGIKVYGLILDKVTGGGGRVQDQICGDISLHETFCELAAPVLKHISSAARAVLLSGNDVMEGKRLQRLEAPLEINGRDEAQGNTSDIGEGRGEPVLCVQGQEDVQQAAEEAEEEVCGEVSLDCGEA